MSTFQRESWDTRNVWRYLVLSFPNVFLTIVTFIITIIVIINISWDTRNVWRYLLNCPSFYPHQHDRHYNYHHNYRQYETQIQLQREELLLNSAQSAKRARMGRFLHQGENHPEGFDKLSGNDHDDHEHGWGHPETS